MEYFDACESCRRTSRLFDKYHFKSWIVCFLSGTYYCLNMILITLSTFLNVFVVNLSFYGARAPVPKPLKNVSIKIIIENIEDIKNSCSTQLKKKILLINV